ncbi:hypothetical protein HMPREF0322_04438 [Desulfitobacterium hafniense DP7]|uniref:Uncharacterized protein n=1 Tax=Desulfitobacterium hafniense DP7 TaxID=537010 RepID=G9XTY0_DESHA|nr:hypothetical protein HMPREF0322_04438 [Desulfitobacterium hafniense DP7]
MLQSTGAVYDGSFLNTCSNSGFIRYHSIPAGQEAAYNEDNYTPRACPRDKK